jgi:HK97 gp10 family phage protein
VAILQAKLTWKVDPIQAVKSLNQGMRNKALRIALQAGAAPMKDAVVAAAPSETGNLKKAMRIKVKNYKSNNTWVAIIGAASNFKRAKKTTGKNGRSQIKKNKSGEKVFVKPSRYQRPVDVGTKYMRGRHFMASALRRAKSQFDMIARQKLAELIKQLSQNTSKK